MKLPIRYVCLAAVLLFGQGFQSVTLSEISGVSEARWRRASDAWEAGDYPAALPDLISLMKSNARLEYSDRVAALTGEVFKTTEITPDGRNPRLSADGRFVSFETGPPAATVTRIVEVRGDGVSTVADLRGVSAAFDPAGRRVAYLRPSPNAALVLHDLATGQDRVLPTGTLRASAPVLAGNRVLFIGSEPSDPSRSDVYAIENDQPAVRLTDQGGLKSNLLVDPNGASVVYTVTPAPPARGGGAGAGAQGQAPAAAPSTPVVTCAAATASFGVVDVAAKTTRIVPGASVTMSSDGSAIAWLARTADACALHVAPTLAAAPKTLQTASRLAAPAISPDGRLVAYQTMLPGTTNWEILIAGGAGAPRRVTRDVQHDVLPRFLTNSLLLGMMGEPRHRRSHLYDLASNRRTKIFSNNTLRTISPEYVWTSSGDGERLLIQAERDGDTISVERGVYLVDLAARVGPEELIVRLNQQLAAETDLRARMTRAFAPLSAQIKTVTGQISANRIYEYEKAQFDFDSKHITQPGNGKAIDYLHAMYSSFGYSPEIQWFDARPQQQAAPVRTGNVVATLKGTKNPELIYVVSSHFDSVAGGPGADDNTSGTCALLETARALAKTPLPATVVFASFTGEEGGLLGSREFVRLAAQNKWNVVGALNNDMIGWAGEGARMDNTIRFSNAGIRDLQHGAAFLFSKLITYDAKYYRGTDAHAFFDGWGDIVGGIGSYPILANPNYHQSTDLIDTMNFQQIAETAKVTAATIVHLASSPSRLKGLKVVGSEVTWTPSPEAGVTAYIVAYGKGTDPSKMTRVRVTAARAALPALPAGTTVAVKAVNARGLEGWDWATTVVR
jgi:hypothetical protein